jgi:hypothetical protein
MSTQTSVYPGSEPASPQVWRADSYVMAEWLMRGLGWAWLPRHVVQYPTYQGQMVELDSEWTPPALVVELVWRRDEPWGRRRAGWPNVLPCTCRRSAKKPINSAAMNRTLYTCCFTWAAVGGDSPVAARAQGAGLCQAHWRALLLWLAADATGRDLGACGVGGREHRRRADDPRLAATLSTAADHRHLHDPDRLERIQAMFANEPRIQHCYLPYDLPCAAARFLDRVQPSWR